MRRQLLHTPEGVRDIYNGECEKKLKIQEELHRTLLQFGYHTIQTPTFEFFDVFNREIGTIPSKDLYKFFDREGNTLVLRPDITPSIARAAAMYFEEETMPIRLCYMGNIFINNSSYQGRLKESTQLGAELIGDNSIEADAEILAMTVESMKRAGLKEFQISVGHAEFFKGLAEAAGLSEEQEDELRELIANKNFFGVEEVIANLPMEEDLRQLFGLLDGFYDSPEQFAQAKQFAAKYERVAYALEHLSRLHEVLKSYQVEKYISYEMGAISDYHYYTGIIFAGYTFGSGEPVVKGGRYDKLLKYFGKDAPSIGFAIALDQLLAAVSRQKTENVEIIPRELILYTEGKEQEAIHTAKTRREQGAYVEFQKMTAGKAKSDYEAYAKRMGITEITFMDGE
ncbi:MAG: ATP phosphoribosyltransferase regulatory subunit [Lachnospiraceae bacterium]|nr:ATP phosphoribosyltransferase regulatory subunit [Lachnospiraceae bacterium]MDD7379253.1 ATP phosphoribosyltransferase regulatory subunit [Lachnospiraceae bacterium]MDY4618321.1 ATP phosphoribosyltransferase regulatory subunit [Lachnospiraceae bacterium]